MASLGSATAGNLPTENASPLKPAQRGAVQNPDSGVLLLRADS